MIFPYDSNSRFSDPRAASPTQRPAARSDARKRAHPSEIRPKGGLSDGCGSIPQATSTERGSVEDPHLDNGFAEVIRKAKEEAWDAAYHARWDDDRTGRYTRNPYGEAS